MVCTLLIQSIKMSRIQMDFRSEPFENQTSKTFRNVFIMEDNTFLQTAQCYNINDT